MAMPDYSSLELSTLIVTLDGPILILLQNRSKERNTWNNLVPQELQRVFELADKDDRVRVVIVTADHKAPAYCAGAGISDGWDMVWTPEEETEGRHAHRDQGGQTALVIYRCRKLTIAAVNGHAAGVGMTAMQLPFDFRFAWAGAKLTFPFVRRGIAPEGTCSFLLPRLLGHSRANSLLLTGDTFTADSPLIQGLYHKLLPTREEVFPAALAFAKELAATTSQVSVAVTKGLIQHPGSTIEETHILDSRAIRELGGGADGAEGIRSFKEKRQPKFTGTLSKNLGSWYPWWRELSTKHRNYKL